MATTLSRVRGLKFFNRILGQPVYLPDGTLLGFVKRIALRRKSGKASEIHIETLSGAIIKVKPDHIRISHGILLASPRLAKKYAEHRDLTPSISASKAVEKLRGILKELKLNRDRPSLRSLAPSPNTKLRVSGHDATSALRELASTLNEKMPSTKSNEPPVSPTTSESIPHHASEIRTGIDNVEYSIDEFIDRFLRG